LSGTEHKLHVGEQGGMMARKDLEKETERPRYYSQFWLDVAAGRRVIGGGKSAQESEETEGGEEESASEMSSKAGKAPKGATMPPVVEAEPAGRRAGHPLRLSGTESLADLAAAAGLVDMESGEEISELEEGDVIEDLAPLPEAEEAELAEEPVEETYSYAELYDEEEEEEEEEGWGPRRGKKRKKPEKPRRREKGRDF
jgi:hypothetical protein